MSTDTDHLLTAEIMLDDIHDRAKEKDLRPNGEDLLKIATLHVLIDIAQTLHEIKDRTS